MFNSIRVALLGSSSQVHFYCNFTCNELCKKQGENRPTGKQLKISARVSAQIHCLCSGTRRKSHFTEALTTLLLYAAQATASY